MSQPSFLKIILFAVLALVMLGALWYLMLTRQINPDRYFVQETEPITFSKLYVESFNGGIRVAPGIGERYMSTANRKISYSINHSHPLFATDYDFEIDENESFILTELSSKRTFVLGKVAETKLNSYDGSTVYTIQVPKEYQASHVFTLGRFPYYVKIQMTMMSSGGMKYSSSSNTVLVSPEGTYLRLSYSIGHLPPIEKTGIYLPEKR